MSIPELARTDRATVFWLGRLGSFSAFTCYSIGSFELPLARWAEADAGSPSIGGSTVYDPAGEWVARTRRTHPSPILVRDASTAEVVAVLEGEFHHVAVHPDGSRLVAGTASGDLAIFDAEDWTLLTRVSGHSSSAYSVAWSPDGTRIASGGNDTVVRIWDASSCDLLLELTGHSLYVKEVRFSPDGTLLASASGDRTVRLWDTVSASERYQRGLVLTGLEREVRGQVEVWRGELGGVAEVATRIRSEWPNDAAHRRAAFTVLAQSERDGQ